MTRGRLLASYGSNTYSYNAEGIRYKKNTTEYIIDGERIIAEKENGVITKRYYYDGSGIAGMWYNGEKYYFRKNLQGDVIGVYDAAGTKIASYTYDPWGVVTSATGIFADFNPFRYRGYYYDMETGFYYLNSRYYDPTVGRFLNPDTFSYLEPETINGLNLYAYALNNPVMYCDPSGHFVSTILGAIFGGIWGALTAVVQGKDVWKSMLVGAASGAFAGLMVDLAVASGGVSGLAIAVVGGFVAGFTGDIASQKFVDGLAWRDVSWGQALIAGGVASITSVLGYGISMVAAGLGRAMPKEWSVLHKMVASLKPMYTPLGSWIGQAVLGFGISVLPSLPGVVGGIKSTNSNQFCFIKRIL